ncbi:MAG: hypothetical protein VYD08_00030 [Pseudomonadota bacterium]|nr:hypothetical protein [Pseudomonadota bacterium]
MSNPLRHLATAIVTACQTKDNAKHVKQSTVLDVLAKHEGFRSIQASDNAASPSTTDETAPLSSDVIALRGMLYANYPNADLLPIELSEAITFKGSLVSHPDWGCDAPFAVMWDLLSDELHAAVDELERWNRLCDRLDGVIESGTDAINEVLIAFPPRIAQFLHAEFDEVTDDTMLPVKQAAEKYRVLERFQYDIESVTDALRNARSAQDR